MKSEIVYGRDIIKNVALKLNLPEKVVSHVFNFIFPHIKLMTKREDVFSIPIKGIGRLYMSTERMKHVLKYRDENKFVSSRQRENHRRLKNKVNKFEEIFKEISAGKFLYTAHKRGLSINNYYFNKQKTLIELEAFQNHGKEYL